MISKPFFATNPIFGKISIEKAQFQNFFVSTVGEQCTSSLVPFIEELPHKPVSGHIFLPLKPSVAGKFGAKS